MFLHNYSFVFNSIHTWWRTMIPIFVKQVLQASVKFGTHRWSLAPIGLVHSFLLITLQQQVTNNFIGTHFPCPGQSSSFSLLARCSRASEACTFVMFFFCVQWFVSIGLVEMFWFVANFGRKLTDQNPHIKDVFSFSLFLSKHCHYS